MQYKNYKIKSSQYSKINNQFNNNIYFLHRTIEQVQLILLTYVNMIFKYIIPPISGS